MIEKSKIPEIGLGGGSELELSFNKPVTDNDKILIEGFFKAVGGEDIEMVETDSSKVVLLKGDAIKLAQVADGLKGRVWETDEVLYARICTEVGKIILRKTAN